MNCPQIRCIKYRQLLQHRSGFNDEKQANRTVLGFLGESDGFLESQYDKRQYSNINFVLAQLSSAGIRERLFSQRVDGHGGELSDTQSADQYVRDQLGKRYDQILHERIFDKTTPKINPTCDGANKVKATAAYGSNKDGHQSRGSHEPNNEEGSLHG